MTFNFNVCLFFIYTNFKDTMGGREKDRDVPSIVLSPKYLQQPGLGQAQTRNFFQDYLGMQGPICMQALSRELESTAAGLEPVLHVMATGQVTLSNRPLPRPPSSI